MKLVDGELVALTADEIAEREADAAQCSAGKARRAILAELCELDAYIPRGLEDTWTAAGFDTSTLVEVQRERLARKQALRAALAE